MYRRTAILGNSRMCKTLIGVQALWHLARLEATMVYKGALMNESVRFESDPAVTGQRGFSEVAVTRPETFVQQWSFAARIKRSVCCIVREPRRTRHRTAVYWNRRLCSEVLLRWQHVILKQNVEQVTKRDVAALEFCSRGAKTFTCCTALIHLPFRPRQYSSRGHAERYGTSL